MSRMKALTRSSITMRRAERLGMWLAGLLTLACLAQAQDKDGKLKLAEAAFQSGKIAEASRQIAAALREMESNPPPRELIGTLRLQATIYIEQRLLPQALSVIQRLKTMPVDSVDDKAGILGLSGAYYQAAGDEQAAEREYLQSIRIWDEANQSLQSVPELCNLGAIYIALQRFHDAIGILEKARGLLGQIAGDDGYYDLVVTCNLATAYAKVGNWQAAARHARQANRLAGAARFGRHDLIAGAYRISADVLKAAGYGKEARDSEALAGYAASMSNALVDVSDLARKPKQD